MPLKTRYLLFCLIASWLFGNTLYAQWNYERPQEGVLQGTGFSVGSNTVVQDDKLPYPALMSTIQNNYRKEAVVALSTHENTSVTLPSSYYCEVAVTVDWWDENNNLTTEYKKLSVSFNADTLHPDTTISYYTFSGAHKVKVTITDIYTEGLSTPLPDIFSVTANLLFERDYVFQCSLNAQATGKYYNSSEDELLVTWQTYNSFLLSNVPGIQFKYDHECDLEWTFYDDGSELVRNYVGGGAHPYTSAAFKNNASRVVCSNYQYQLPLLYSSGYLMFRIRPVKVLPNGQRIAGEWSSDVFPGSSNYIYHISAGHENKLNWQASTTFAEEGKRKSVISYFDGSSKNRQTVTKINTNKMAVVAETIYDNEGRPVATVLPTPAFNQAIQHFDKFNQDMLGNAYTWEDLNATACVPSPGQMSTNSGASKYYSPNNPMQATLPYSNIPDAFKYPFAQTKYTGDLTNRVRASAGPGKDHHFGAAGDRFTKYLYGQPEQTDLIKMFGTEVGEKSHYFKNLVIDPNGQVSVTYQDMHGRTIATALSGDAVNVELDTLDGEDRDTVMLRDTIIDGINQTTTGLSINSTKTFLVSRRALHKFYYSLVPESYIINTCDGKRFCYDCVYDLTIRVTDECGQQLHLLTKRNYTPSDDNGVYFDTSCANNSLPIVDSFELELGVGEYTVSKSLAIAQDAIDYYYNDYISKDTCIKDFEDFYSAALNELDMTGCEFTCESCLQALGDSTTFIDSFFRQILRDNPGAIITEHDTDNAVVAYLQLREVCDMLCDSFSICDAKRNLMLHDMSPTGGQYASYYYNITNNTYVFSATDSSFTNTSILSPNATIYPPGMTLPLYSDPGIVYLDELGNPDFVSISDIDGDGVLDPVTPNQLTQQQFIQNWRPSWAKSLLRFHPEYCDLQFCEIISSSHEYDKRMLAVEDYQTAVTDGFLNPLNDNHSEVPATFIPGTNPDPFFAGIYGTIYANSMKGIMRSYITGTYSGGTLDYSLWELAALSAQCAPTSTLPCSGCTENFYWNTFRNIYLGKKRYWVDEAMKAYYHDCHTNAGGNPSLLSYPNYNSGALAGCTPRFEIVSDIFDNIYSHQLQGDEHQQATTAEQIVRDSAFDCSSYANYWWTQLSGCGYSISDSAQIIGMLIDVCRAGTDPQHVFGASTAAPGSTGFTSFQQVLQWAQANLTSANNYESPDCSEHLINNPLPYEVKTLYYQSAQVDKPEQCICDNIQLYHFQYLHSGLSGTMNFGDYLTNVRNVIITNEDIEMLMQSCQPGACARLDHPISLPYQFGCDNNCASCEQVVEVYHNFQSHFSTMPFGHPNYMTLMQSYMNQNLGMNLTALEYIRFMVDSCGYTDFPGPGELPNQPNTLVKQGNGANKTDGTRTGNLTEDGRFKPFVSYNGNSSTVLVSGNSNSTPPLFVADLANAGLLKRHTTQVNILDSISAIQGLLKNTKSVPHVIASNAPVWGNSFTQKKNQHNAAMQSSVLMLKRRIINAAMARNSAAVNTQKLQQGAFNTNPSALRMPPVSNNLAHVVTNAFTNNNHSANAYNTAYGTAMGTQATANVSTPAQQPAYTNAMLNLPQISSGVGANPLATQAAPKAKLKRYARYVATTTLLQPDSNANNRQQRGLTIPVGQIPVTDATRQMLNVINLPAHVSQQRGNGIFNVYNADNKPSLTNTGSNSHQVQYFITEHDNWCDSVAASIQVFDSLPYRDWWWFVTTMQDNLGVSYPLAHWLSIADTCNLPCTELIRCSRADSVLQQFAAEYPQYAVNSLPQIWVTYLNQNNGSGYYTSYNVDEWPLLLNCCNVSYPAADTGTYCDKLNQLVSFDYFKPDLYYLMYNLNFVFGASHYSPALGTVIANNLDYWVQQADSCGTPCSDYINCQRIDSVMDKFESNYPQYVTNSLAYIWVNYLNQNFAAGGYFTYAQNDWVTMLNCCGINYPAADTAATHCDTLKAVVDLYASQGLYNVAYQLDQFYGSTHYDSVTSSYVSNGIVYWLQQMNSCGISCSTFVSCTRADSVMHEFVTLYPEFAVSSMTSLWVDYLNQHNGSGNWSTYTYEVWQQLLSCCNITYPAADTTQSRCDSIWAIVNMYQYYSNSYLLNQLNYQFGSSHYDSGSGQWVYSDFAYWLNQFNTCSIPCTTFVKCSQLNTVMQQFKSVYPQYANNCLPIVWVNYLNQYNASGININYNETEWRALMSCCGVTPPATNTDSSQCATIQAIVTVYQSQGLATIASQLNNIYGYSHYDSTTSNWIYHDTNYWLSKMDSCGISCSMFVNCTQLSAVMQQFRSTYPQYASYSLPLFWVDYLNQHNASGNWVSYDENTWRSFLNCCDVVYPQTDTNTAPCTVIQAMYTFYHNEGMTKVVNQLNNYFGYSHTDPVSGMWVNNDLSYWISRLDSCGVPCDSVVNCQQLNTVMQQFISNYPQYATNCPTFIWVNYLNNNNGTGWWGTYSYNEWKSMLNCCGIAYPTEDSLGSYCDTLLAAATSSGGNLYNIQSILNSLYGYSHYNPETGNWVNHNNEYWLSELDSCGIPCSTFFSCSTLTTVMNNFRTEYPQFAVHCPSTIWVDYLNNHNASGTGNWYGQQDWVIFLNCCGVEYPTEDSTSDTCQLLSQIAIYNVQHSGYGNLANQLNNQFGWNHYDPITGSWIYNDLNYWLARLDSCGVTCNQLHDCAKVDSIMSDFYETYPGYTTSAPEGIWTNYLYQHGASNGVWYNAEDWKRILGCCGISIPSSGSGSHCDSVNMALNYFYSMPGNHSLWDFETAMASIFGWGYNQPITGIWTNYTDEYWFDLVRGCGLPCPAIIKCSVVSELLTEFYSLYPQYTNYAPGAIWAAYLNNHNGGNGNWYNDKQWKALLSCCNITLPQDTGYDYCETMAGVVNTNPATSQFPHLPALYQMRSMYGWGYNDPATGEWKNNPVSYYIDLLDSCGISCTVLIDSGALAASLHDFYAANPQYADSCPPVVIQEYLNNDMLNNQEWLPYEDWATFADCSGIPFPDIDTVLNACDTAYLFNIQISMVEHILIDTLGEPCVPAWLYKVLFMEDMPEFSLSNACGILNGCGYQCPDTCVFYSHCDSIKSIVHIFQVMSTYNNDGGDGGDDENSEEMLAGIASFVMGESYTYSEFMQEYIKCDTGFFCEHIPDVITTLDTLFSSFDSCIHINVYVGVMNGVTGFDMSYEEWCNLLATCEIPCPVVCTDSLIGQCDTAKLAYQTYLNVIANYSVGDSDEVLAEVFSYIFNRTVSLVEAQSMINRCVPRPCMYDSAQRSAVLAIFATFDGCVPAWVIPYLYNNLGENRDHPATTQEICSMFASCDIPCPDTCVVPPVGPIPCDSVIAFSELYEYYKDHPFTANTPFGMIYWYLSQAYFGYQVPEWQFLQMRDSCQKQTCDSSNIQIWDEYSPFFTGYGECTPAWAIEFIYQRLLNEGLHYADICGNLSNCGIQCPDTCAGPVTPCDIILQVNQAAQSVFVNYGARDTSYIINLFYTYLTGDSITQEQFYIQLDSCQNTCNHNVEVAMRNFGAFFASFDTCVPRWVVEMAFAQIMDRPVAYAEICELLAGCGFPCPDTCAPVTTPCDSIIQVYNTLQHVFVSFARADTTEVTVNMTQQLFGTPLTWPQLLSQYRHCTGTEGPTLCNRPLLPPINPEAEDSCFEVMQEYAYHNAAYAYEEYLRNLHEDFVNKYIEKCLGAYKHENFDYTHPNGEYHYTLYYYDQGGNLVKTIPPSGFKSQLDTTPTPHLLPTVYRYNTLNQVVEQRTPDAGTSRFWYDRIGKLVFSENAKQRPLGQFTYTLYDPLQRIKEVGQFDGVDMSIYGNWDALGMDPTMYWYTYLNSTTNATQLTRTYYDEDIYTTGGKYLRNRVAHATYEDVDDHNVATFQSATHYSYDIHGNVDKLIQVNNALAAIGHDKKTLEYRYDLLSGKVNQVIYQRGQPDQFIHRYEYDGDNRITDVYTSRDNVVEDHDAYYQYYLHGPLARTQLGGNLITGRQSVQGLDYTYTLQGWLKGVNSSALTTATDPGHDGIGALTARDRFGFTLGYYDGDFQPIAWGGTITAANHLEADISLLAQKGLYNGNIASMAVNVGVLNAPLAYKFSYDLLNRLKATDAFDGLDPAQNQWLNNTALTAYHNELTYDQNGNIRTNKRNGTASTPDMDDMAYEYYPETNRLRHVSDNVAIANYTVDIDNQIDSDNYKYDAIGNLVQDVAEGINNIEWSLAGKISAIYKTNGDIMRFAYSPNGNRISKEYYTAATTSTKHTYYTHDATGNIMATYDEADGVLTLAEQPIYGSTRIGEIMPKLQLYPAPAAVTDPFITQVCYHMLNKKQYELSNHLGNVQTTISDRRLAIGSPFDHYEVEVVSAQDYYPFGMVMPEREYYTERYRFGFGGHEKDSEIKGEGNSVDMGARMLDTRIGRTGSLDPKMGLYPGISPYAYALNTPVNAIDPDGKLVIFVNGYRPCLPGVNVYREVKRDDKVFRGDKFGYWGGVDGQFMNKIGDHNAVYADGDAPTLTAKSQFGFNARMAHGRQAAQDLISKINSGEVVLKKNDKGEVVESIKVVSHSMGYAYSLGMIKELEKAGYKVEVSYNLAPENPKGGDIPNNVVRSVQYGSGPKDPWYNQDRIAPQSEINNVDEIAPIPDKNTAGENIPKGPYDSHAVSNYGKWIFGLNKDQQGYVAPRQDTQAADPK